MAGEIFVHKVMTDEEVRSVLIEKGYTPMPRKDGDIDLSEYGFQEGEGDYIRKRGAKVTTDHFGEVRNNKFGTPMKIIRYGSYDDIDIEFQDEFKYVKTTTYSNFKTGCVKNPYDRTLFGVGYMGVGKYMAKVNGKMTDEYEKWTGLIQRCYYDDEMFPTYCDKVTVCEEWHNFQNFAEWLEKNRYKVNERLHLDKDILFPNCKMYSPKTCILTPQRINMLFSNKPNKRGLPNGITKQVKGYLAKYGGEKLGVFHTLEEAYQEYAKAKEKKIKEVADEYKDIIPKKLYDALYAYKVDIRNDKNYVAA